MQTVKKEIMPSKRTIIQSNNIHIIELNLNGCKFSKEDICIFRRELNPDSRLKIKR